jgi:hypothetical protein
MRSRALGLSGWQTGASRVGGRVAEIPGDISRREVTRPIVLFTVIRTLAVSIAVALAFELHLPNAY